MTKAQSDMIGLVIIVVIITILILFLSLSSANRGINDRRDTLSAEIAQAFLESAMHRKTNCGPALADIIKNCYDENTNCGDACAYAKNRLEDDLELNFGEKKREYSLFVKKGHIKKIEISSENSKCGITMEQAGSGVLALPDFPGVITVELQLC